MISREDYKRLSDALKVIEDGLAGVIADAERLPAEDMNRFLAQLDNSNAFFQRARRALQQVTLEGKPVADREQSATDEEGTGDDGHGAGDAPA